MWVIQPSSQFLPLSIERSLIEHDALQFSEQDRLLVHLIRLAIQMTLGETLPRLLLGGIKRVECGVKLEFRGTHGLNGRSQLQQLCGYFVEACLQLLHAARLILEFIVIPYDWPLAVAFLIQFHQIVRFCFGPVIVLQVLFVGCFIVFWYVGFDVVFAVVGKRISRVYSPPSPVLLRPFRCFSYSLHRVRGRDGCCE